MQLAPGSVGGTEVASIQTDFVLQVQAQVPAFSAYQRKAIDATIYIRSYSLAMQSHEQLRTVCSDFSLRC